MKVLAARMKVQDEKRPTLSECKTACPGVPLSEREVLEKQIVERQHQEFAKLGQCLSMEN